MPWTICLMKSVQDLGIASDGEEVAKVARFMAAECTRRVVWKLELGMSPEETNEYFVSEIEMPRLSDEQAAEMAEAFGAMCIQQPYIS